MNAMSQRSLGALPQGASAHLIMITTWALCVGATACRTAQPTPPAADAAAPAPVPLPQPLPGWLGAPADVRRAADLEEVAALLCGRDTDSVIDDEARQATGLWDGQVMGLLRRAPTQHEAQTALVRDARALLEEKRATHAGVVTGETPAGEACAALVGVRRLVEVMGARPRAALAKTGVLELAVRLPPQHSAVLYVLGPDGFVLRSPLDVAAPLDAAAPLHAASPVRLALPPRAGEGRYVAELVVDRIGGPSDPEVALVWPWVVGAPREAPFPEVLFPDEGHDDAALTHRAEALLQRLRNELLLEPFKLSPALAEVALERARAVAARGALGHRVADAERVARDPIEELRARFGDVPRMQFVRLAEVQAQASSLAEAWRALLDSPAHRHALVEPAFTHAGSAVVRGKDAATRPTLTLVTLVARRPPQRDLDAVRAHVLDLTNAAREQRGLHPLEENAHLHRVALRLANAMKEQRRVDDALLGAPVGQVALEEDGSFTRVQPLVARTDDPLLLVARGAPALLLGLDVTRVGLGLALEPQEGTFYVVVLAGE